MSVGDKVAQALSLGGLFEEAREFLRGPFTEDEWERAMLAQQIRANQYLAQIAANTGQVPDLPDIDVDRDERDLILPSPQPSPQPGGGGEDERQQQERQERERQQKERQQKPHYWVTEEPITVNNGDNYQSTSWGFSAKTVVLIFDAEVEIAFLPPGDVGHREITLGTQYSPFSLSGVDGIFASTLWYRQGADATSPAELTVFAFE